jgi:FkbM family methyltransferase
VNIEKTLTHPRYGFRYAQMKGCPHPDADHASAWSFEDEQVVRDRHWHIKKGDVVLDVGAAFGSYTLPALAMGARVVAFSPADFDTELLNLNLQLNPELAKRCLVVRDGLHERDGWFDPDHSTFASDDHPHAVGTNMASANDRAAFAGWLRCRSLDSFMSNHPGIDRVDWIKMDIEGAELGALKGGIETLRKYRPKCLIECHQFHNGNTQTDVFAFMESLGYQGVAQPHCAVSHAYFEVK